MNLQLTTHFSFEELTASETAARHNIDNTPPIQFDQNLRHLAEALEAVRVLLDDNPIHINSGYRCRELNALVGGQPSSAHIAGLAADFIAPAFGPPQKIMAAIAKSPLGYEQIIIEYYSWVHIAVALPGCYGHCDKLVIDGSGTRAWTG